MTHCRCQLCRKVAGPIPSTICLSSMLVFTSIGKVFGTKANYVIAECEYQEGEGEEEDEPDTQVSPCLSPALTQLLCVSGGVTLPGQGEVCSFCPLPWPFRRRMRSLHKKKAKKTKVGSVLCRVGYAYAHV